MIVIQQARDTIPLTHLMNRALMGLPIARMPDTSQAREPLLETRAHLLHRVCCHYNGTFMTAGSVKEGDPSVGHNIKSARSEPERDIVHL